MIHQHQFPPTDTLGELIRLILTNNVFEFDNKHYRQIQGAAMGTKMAPSYAIIYMNKIEREMLQNQKPPTKFLRFIDDILMFDEHGEEITRTYEQSPPPIHKIHIRILQRFYQFF